MIEERRRFVRIKSNHNDVSAAIRVDGIDVGRVALITTGESSRFLSSLSLSLSRRGPRWQRPFLVDEIRRPIPYYRGLSTSFLGFNYATAVSGGSNGSLPFIAFTAVKSCLLRPVHALSFPRRTSWTQITLGFFRLFRRCRASLIQKRTSKILTTVEISGDTFAISSIHSFHFTLALGVLQGSFIKSSLINRETRNDIGRDCPIRMNVFRMRATCTLPFKSLGLEHFCF